MNRVIFHIDVNSAFLSWEAAYRLHHLGASLDLRSIPSVINGNMDSRHGIILAKSHPCKKYKISTGETLVSAVNKCPNLYLAPPNYNLYQKCSKAMFDLLLKYSPNLEEYSIDEAFLDVTQVIHHYPTPEKLADIIKNDIEYTLGFTVNIGISSNKLLAKMASDFEKPNKVHSLYVPEIKDKMWTLPVGDLFYVGKSSQETLRKIGIHTIGELAQSNKMILSQHLKKQGELIWNYANGIDPTPVTIKAPLNKGYGNSTTIAFDVSDEKMAKHVLLGLTETVGNRLREHNVEALVVSIGIKYYNLKSHSHQMQLNASTNITQELYDYVCILFEQLWSGPPIRQLGVHVLKVTQETTARQYNLFETKNHDKYNKLDHAVDTIRKRYGMDSMMRASFIDSKIDHLTGGITREKRSVDYNNINLD